ncbi:MAG: hypothetical protein Q8N76_03500 [Candidatus Omnitrophota bacterium]|nr:hypothetical protein [Candidatus Omnitrophota bacterium]
MRKIILCVFFIAFIFGCAASSNKILPKAEDKSFTETPIVVTQVPPAEPIENTVAQVVTAPLYTAALEASPQVPKIAYSQIVNLLNEFIDMKEMSSVSGENSYLGISENKLTILEIKGDKDSIKEASMKLVYPKGIDKSSIDLNNAMMSRFLKNAAPELSDWAMRISEILDKFNSLKTGIEGIKKEDIALSNKIIQILYDKNADYIVATLKPQL